MYAVLLLGKNSSFLGVRAFNRCWCCSRSKEEDEEDEEEAFRNKRDRTKKARLSRPAPLRPRLMIDDNIFRSFLSFSLRENLFFSPLLLLHFFL
jgi:hypothetical protein|tara:strand:- start:340 stop:621 length:282 start_codon:yes stop_codon:yes gene_type:complete